MDLGLRVFSGLSLGFGCGFRVLGLWVWAQRAWGLGLQHWCFSSGVPSIQAHRSAQNAPNKRIRVFTEPIKENCGSEEKLPVQPASGGPTLVDTRYKKGFYGILGMLLG